MNKVLSYFKNFTFIRWVRLTIGIVIIAESFRTGTLIVSLIGVALVLMAFLNAGCDASKGACIKTIN